MHEPESCVASHETDRLGMKICSLDREDDVRFNRSRDGNRRPVDRMPQPRAQGAADIAIAREPARLDVGLIGVEAKHVDAVPLKPARVAQFEVTRPESADEQEASAHQAILLRRLTAAL